jgi:hypothetical protein
VTSYLKDRDLITLLGKGLKTKWNGIKEVAVGRE